MHEPRKTDGKPNLVTNQACFGCTIACGRISKIDADGNPSTDPRVLRQGGAQWNLAATLCFLDQGLVFVAFNRNPAAQFAVIQRRLESEPMTDYISPVGGGYYFAPPGVRSAGDWVGSGLSS